MTTDGVYNRQTSPEHNAYSRERDMADVDGEYDFFGVTLTHVFN